MSREYEIKFSLPLHEANTRCTVDRECDVAATMEITVGPMDERYGTDYQACPFHEEQVLEVHAEKMSDDWLNRKELRAESQAESRGDR